MTAVAESMRVLLAGLVDYAGLFPPAQLAMAAAVRNFADYRDGEYGWMLGRFIVPSARLDEFEGAAAARFPRDRNAVPWLVSMLAGRDPIHDAEQVFAFNERHAHAAVGRVVIDTLETRAATADEVANVVRSAPAGVTTYVEIPVSPDPTSLLAAIAAQDARAKVRTGGVTPEAFPSSRDLARFLHAAAQHQVPFKATAGLHHPIRATYPLTYEPQAARGPMHGFLNVFLAAAFAEAGLGTSDLERLLDETDPRAFSFDEGGLAWRGSRVEVPALGRLRTRVAVAFGSCSFTEPVDDLRALGFLP